MSNIYITEPPTNGKIIFKTTVGEIEIEIWSKETPIACRNFVQLCMEGYYNDTTFHRIVKGFIVQGGDPTGTGEGGESIYDGPFKTESHSRLSFNRRGLLGMACSKPNSNSSQFFFTLGEASELNGKHTLFGRVVGNTLFNMLRLADVEVTHGDRPSRLHRILKTEVILNPYDDIIPRRLAPKKQRQGEEEPTPTAKATKNFSLLSFGNEAEEDDEVATQVEQKFRGRGKSAHDLINDDRLSTEAVIVNDEDRAVAAAAAVEREKEAEDRRLRREDAANSETAEERLAKEKRLADVRQEAKEVRMAIARTTKLTLAREEAARQREMATKKRDVQAVEEDERVAKWEAEQREKTIAGFKAKAPIVADVDDFRDEVASYRAKTKKNKMQKDHEADTMALLNRFKSRLAEAKISKNDESTDVESNNSAAWLRCKLQSDEPAAARQVLDPSIENPDRYDLFDPRNPLNVRKRDAMMGEDSGKKKSRR